MPRPRRSPVAFVQPVQVEPQALAPVLYEAWRTTKDQLEPLVRAGDTAMHSVYVRRPGWSGLAYPDQAAWLRVARAALGQGAPV